MGRNRCRRRHRRQGLPAAVQKPWPRSRRRLDLSRRRKPRGGACDGEGAVFLGRDEKTSLRVIPGLVPGIHVLKTVDKQERGWPGLRREDAVRAFAPP